MTRSGRLTIVAAVAALLAVLPLIPVTETGGWLVPAGIAIGVVALAGAASRRWRAPRGVVPLVQLSVLILWLGLLVAADVAWMAVVPTPSWFDRLRMVASEGIDDIIQYAAPVPVERGLLLLIVGGAGLVAIAVELAVFALRKVPLAGLPLGVMYSIAASTARDAWSWIWFVPPAIGFLMLLVAEGRTRVARWGRSASPSARHPGLPQTDSLARSGRRAGAVALAAAVAVPAWLPALTEGFVGGGGSGGSGGGRTIRTDNPIVDLHRDLVRPDNVDMLRYVSTSDRPEYIRTATLDVFNGEEWRLSQRDVPESQHVDQGLPWPPGLTVDGDRELDEIEYEFEITENFGSRWLPLAYPAQTIEIDGDWRFDLETLDVVADEDEDVQGKTYRAVSIAVPRDAAALRDATTVDDEFQDMLELPDGIREELDPYLTEAVGERTNPHQQAVALQAWFRSEGGFSYSLERDPGTSSSHLVDFLVNRIGYCEQFSATMAIMARALGIPARVAVGFTPGELQDDGSRLVSAHDAHSWPELYFEGTGWVRFEPTPSTRTGSAPAWTLPVPEEDDDTDAQTGASTAGDSAQDDLGAAEAGDLPAGELDGAGAAIEQPSRWPIVVLIVAIIAVLLSLPQVVARLVRTARWRRAAGDPVAEAEAAWRDFRDGVRDAGFRWDAAATPRGMRRQLFRQVELGGDGSSLVWHLVHTVERARYAARSEAVSGIRDDAAALRRALLATQPRSRRIRSWLWPVVVRDLLSAVTATTADGLTWLDTAGERLRARFPIATRR